MLILKCVVVYCLCLYGIAGAMLIDSGLRRSGSQKKLIDKNGKNRKCSLSQELIDEIRSYQPVVDKIVASVVNGQYSGSTWKR